MKSFVELNKYLLKQLDGVRYFLSEKLCQDPLESFLAKRGSEVAILTIQLLAVFSMALNPCEYKALLLLDCERKLQARAQHKRDYC